MKESDADRIKVYLFTHWMRHDFEVAEMPTWMERCREDAEHYARTHPFDDFGYALCSGCRQRTLERERRHLCDWCAGPEMREEES